VLSVAISSVPLEIRPKLSYGNNIVPHWLSTDPNIYDLEWPWIAILPLNFAFAPVCIDLCSVAFVAWLVWFWWMSATLNRNKQLHRAHGGCYILYAVCKLWKIGCEAAPLVVLEQEVAPVQDFCYLGSITSSPLDDLRRRRCMAWSVSWKLETVWCAQSRNLETKLSLFDSLVLSAMLYGAETWPISTQMNQLINSFAISAYRIMTGVKRLDKVRNTTVLRSVSRNDLIHTVHDRQLRFVGHMLRKIPDCAVSCDSTAFLFFLLSTRVFVTQQRWWIWIIVIQRYNTNVCLTS